MTETQLFIKLIESIGFPALIFAVWYLYHRSQVKAWEARESAQAEMYKAQMQAMTEHEARMFKRYFAKAYGLEEEDFDVVSNTPVPGDEAPAEFAQAPGAGAAVATDPMDALSDVLTPETLQGLAGQLLAPVLDLVASAGSVEDIAERLHGVYPDMDDSTFEDLLTRAIFIASVWGRLSAQAEAKEAGA